MPHEVIRPEREADFYVVWSSIVDDAVACGGAREVLDFLTEPRAPTQTEQHSAEAMIGRAAAYGGSGETVWEEEYLLCRARGLLPRASLADYARALANGDPTEHLLQPLER